MAPGSTVYINYTGEINPQGATPVLTREQVWAGLEIKVEHAQDFVSAITSTDVISRKQDEHGRPVTTREVVFKEENRRVKEEVTLFHPTKVVFLQTDSSRVQNLISVGAKGDLYMTYDFEWLLKEMDASELEKQREKLTKMSKMAVESSLDAIREMVKNGRIKA